MIVVRIRFFSIGWRKKELEAPPLPRGGIVPPVSV